MIDLAILRRGLAGVALSVVCLGAAAGADSGRTVLFVTGQSGTFQSTDAHVAQHLRTLGLAVTRCDQSNPEPAAAGADLVIISGSVGAHRIESRYRRLPGPVLTWNPGVLYDLGMTGDVRDRDYGYDNRGRQLFLYFVNAPHPLNAHLPNGMLIPYSDSQARISWGKPGLGATIIATLPGEADKAVIFGYEKGALMDREFSAPARRAMLFLSEATFDQLNDTGLKLFDAAVFWALGTPR